MNFKKTLSSLAVFSLITTPILNAANGENGGNSGLGNGGDGGDAE